MAVLHVAKADVVAVTELGNIVVAGAAAVGASVWLMLRGERVALLRFVLAVSGTFVVTTLLKLVAQATHGAFAGHFYAFSRGAPSGHAAMSMVIYGGVAMLAAQSGRVVVRLIALTLASAVIAGVSITRVLLHAHLPADVALGLLIGGAAACLVAASPLRRDGEWPRTLELVLMTALFAAGAHLAGFRLTSTQFL
jgi:membrane-associated phospholipid phosphatase